MIDSIQHLVRMTDAVIARLYLSLFREQNSLVTLLFHSLFRNASEIDLNLVDPLERTTVEHLRQCLAYFRENGYTFVSPEQLLNGLEPTGKYALVTFDDGYFNNSHALPVLEEFQAPAVLFVTTNNVRENRKFWWDVLYHQRKGQGATDRAIYHEGMSMKSMRTEEIEARLMDRFGRSAFVPQSDIDRPFTPDELREFARHPLVSLGNHTANHAILTNYTESEVDHQIVDAQESLRAMTGVSPKVIAYPNGAHTGSILKKCGDVGIQVGFTVKPIKNRLPIRLDSPDVLRLGRFAPLGDRSIATQCRTYRSDLQLYATLRSSYLRLRHAQPAR